LKIAEEMKVECECPQSAERLTQLEIDTEAAFTVATHRTRLRALLILGVAATGAALALWLK